MIAIVSRSANSLFWAVLGWAFAILGNTVALEWSRRWPYAVHIDELLVGLMFGLMRYMCGEWKIERVHAAHKMQERVGDALTILRHSSDELAKQKALITVLEAWDQRK